MLKMNLGQVYTKAEIADFMVSLFSLENGSLVLDPCFGHGAFLNALLKKGGYIIEGIEIDHKSYEYCGKNFSTECILTCGDFFSLPPVQKYDGIIMNPPYIRHEEIDDLSEFYGISKARLKNKILHKLDAKANLYMYFILYALQLLKEGGELVAIFPNSWEKARSGKNFIDTLSSYGSITEYIRVEGSPFEGNPLVEVLILKIVKGESSIMKENVLSEVAGIWHIEELQESSCSYNTTSSLMSNITQLKNLAKIRRGISTGCNEIFINAPLFDKRNFVPIVSSPKDITGYSTAGARTDSYLKILPEDILEEEIQSYLNNCELHIQESRYPKSLYALIESHKPWYFSPPLVKGVIIFPYIIRTSFRFIMNESDYYVRDNFYSINPYEDRWLLMALLNNYYVWYNLETIGKTYGNGLLKIQKYDVDNLVIINPVVISVEDKNRLQELARNLVNKNDIQTIDLITSILEPYYKISNIKTLWKEKYEKRLNQTN